MADAPICDVCGAVAKRITSLGEPRSRRFFCSRHNSPTCDKREDNRRFREDMTYDDALALMRRVAQHKGKSP